MSVRQTARLRRAAPHGTPPAPRQVRPAPRIAAGVLILLAIAAVLIGRGRGAETPAPDRAPSPLRESRPPDPGPRPDAAPDRWVTPSAARSSLGARPALPGSRATPDVRALRSAIDEWTSDRAGTYGVVAVDLATGARIAVNGSTEFPPASLHKLLILAEVYRQIETGDVALTDRLTIGPDDVEIGDPEGGIGVGETVTVDRALEAMTAVSSNAAAAALTRHVGPGSVAGAADRLGLRHTRYDPADDEDAATTPADLAAYFEDLAAGRIVSRAASQQMIDRLARSRLDDRLPAALPPGTPVAHKTGDMLNVVHDAGIVYAPRGPIVMVLLSQGDGNGRAAENLRHLARIIYEGVGSRQ